MTSFFTESAFKVKLIERSKTPKIAGTVVKLNRPNLNKRIYPSKVGNVILKQAKKRLESNTLLGNLSHQDSEANMLSKACVKWTKISAGKDELYGEATLLDTPAGKTLLGLLREGIGNIGASLCGTGSVSLNEDGFNVIEDDYNLASIDIVAQPSNEEEVKLIESYILESYAKNETATDIISSLLEDTLFRLNPYRGNR